MNGVLTCARYAFAPNYYKYCGPDGNRIQDYLAETHTDAELEEYISQFRVLYPYLSHIAHENGIADPLDPRVVEAYWVGNQLLEHIGMASFVDHLMIDQRLRDRVPPNKRKWILQKIPQGARMHHSFHVFSVFTRTGHHTVDHTIDTMNECRISWGKITKKQKPRSLSARAGKKLEVQTQKLVYQDGKLVLVPNVTREIDVPTETNTTNTLTPGDLVTFHWGFFCDRVTPQHIDALAHYTRINLNLANRTI